MNEQPNSNENLIKELEKLLNVLQRPSIMNSNPEQYPNELLKKIDEFNQWAEKFQETTNTLIESTGITRDEMLKRLGGVSDQISGQTKLSLEHINHLKQNTMKTMESLGLVVDEETKEESGIPKDHKSEFERVRSQKNEETNKKRSRKFKKFGLTDKA